MISRRCQVVVLFRVFRVFRGSIVSERGRPRFPGARNWVAPSPLPLPLFERCPLAHTLGNEAALSLATRHSPLATTGQKWPCRPTARKMVQSIMKSKQNPAIRPEFRHVNDQLPTHDRARERTARE